jgi:hypothetical protein
MLARPSADARSLCFILQWPYVSARAARRATGRLLLLAFGYFAARVSEPSRALRRTATRISCSKARPRRAGCASDQPIRPCPMACFGLLWLSELPDVPPRLKQRPYRMILLPSLGHSHRDCIPPRPNNIVIGSIAAGSMAFCCCSLPSIYYPLRARPNVFHFRPYFALALPPIPPA